MNSQKKYIPSAEAKANPFTLKVNGVVVGVGGGGWVYPSPPALPYFIREANEEEYEILFKRGHTNSINEHVEPTNNEDSASVVAKPNSSNTARDRRSTKKHG